MIHGKPSNYTHKKCRCAECTASWTAYMTEYRARKRQQQWTGEETWHGSMSGYDNYGCRCVYCSTARRLYDRRKG